MTVFFSFVYFLFLNVIFSQTASSLLPSTSPNNNSSSPTNSRLPKSIVPVDYDLHLIPDNSNSTFYGQVVITVIASNSTNIIKLHANQLEIKTIEVTDLNNKFLAIKKFNFETEKEFLNIELNRTLEVNQKYLIKISYFSEYDDKSGHLQLAQVKNKTCHFSATRFQPNFARKAFPCFDEPNMKATIKMKITHDSDLTALANMPVESVLRNGNETTTTFILSPVKMSTYTMAWAVGCFEAIEMSTSRGLKVRFFAQPDKLQLASYPLSIAVKILEFYENYFQITFPLPKLDFVAFPYYPSGGMENWGLIIVNEVGLFNPRTKSFFKKKAISKLISHELAHNWFGNLVTMDWWDDIWLNEGFTSHMEYKGLSVVHPEWEPEQHFIIDRFQKAMELDSTSASHSVIQHIDDPNNIKKIYDISYNKGACVVRMLEDFIGEEAFRKAIRNYVKRFKENNAKSSELWAEVSSVIKDGVLGIKNISLFMDKWTNDKNFPVVNVLKTNNSLTLKQTRFVKQQTSNETLDQRPWIIPINSITQRGVKTILLFDKHEDTFQLNIVENEWIKLNHQQMGYFIVNYTTEDWHRLTLQLKNNHQVLSPLDRANLLFDCFELANSGQLSYSTAFNLLSYLENEDHAIPWATAYRRIFADLIKLVPNNDRWCLRMFLKELSMKMYQKFDWNLKSYEENSLNQRYLRQLVLSSACHNGNDDCLKHANWYLMKHYNDGTVNPDVRFNFDFIVQTPTDAIIYDYGMALVKDLSVWLNVFKRYKSEKDQEEKMRLLKALGGIKDAQLLKTVVSYAMDDNNTIGLDERVSFFMLMKIISFNYVGRSIVWSMIQDNPGSFFSRFNSSDDSSDILKELIGYFNEKREFDEFEKLLREYPNEKLREALDQQKKLVLNQNQVKTALVKWLEEAAGLNMLCKDWLIKHPSGLKSTWKCCFD